MSYDLSIVVFRRDLRVFDNTAFRKAAKASSQVLPVFIFDERQFSDENEYRSSRALQFLVESLKYLDEQLQDKGGELHVLKGKPQEVVSELISSCGAQAVFVNEDVTPFSRSRDEAMRKAANDLDTDFVSCHDLFLTRPGSVRTQQDTPYKVFTPYMREASKRSVPEPVEPGDVELYTDSCPHSWPEYKSFFDTDLQLLVHGGRSQAKELLDELDELGSYSDSRDIPSVKGTSRLSAHHKFGTISVRETFHRVRSLFGASHKLIAELYWRDFYSHLVYDFQWLLSEKKAFQEKYQGMSWREDDEQFRAWCNGMTGYPIVDAGMRELNNTGYMHNRVRMIVASFLTKHLLLDWRLGEKYFATQLTDYDPSVNNGSWQWAASTGCDAQPYFRIFNPWSQQKRYDSEASYIKKWVFELEDSSAKDIHKPGEVGGINEYPDPIVEHSSARERALSHFKNYS